MTIKKMLVVGAVVAGAFGAHSALATPPSGTMTRTELAKGTTTEPISISSEGETVFSISTVVIEPGAQTGWHSHPGAELSVIKAGALTIQTGTACEPVTLTAGQVFHAPAGVAHVARNDGDTPAEIYVTYTLPAAAEAREDAPEACPAG